MLRGRPLFIALLSLLLMVAGGCKGAGQRHLDAANASYRAGDYHNAFRQALLVADGGGTLSQQASYTAGMSAYRLGDNNSAQLYLERVVNSSNARLASDALATLGVIHSSRSQFEKAADVLERSARLAEGQDKALGYYHAALAQQRLGRWASARASLQLARRHNQDAELAGAIARQLEVTGFTVQVGAFSSQDNARETAEALATEAAGQRGMGAPWIAVAQDAQGQPLHLVQIGQFSTYQQALDVRSRLNRPSALVVPLAGSEQPGSP